MAATRVPKVFISATSGDLLSVRQLVKNTLLTLGCYPVEQTHFAPDWRTVEQMLREKIESCDALIHIAGVCYGTEPDPETLAPGAARRSYTQIEYHLGRALQSERGDQSFRVYVFVCPLDFKYDLPTGATGDFLTAEPEALRALQEQHRAALLRSPYIYEVPATPEEIHSRVLTLQEPVLHLQWGRHQGPQPAEVEGLGRGSSAAGEPLVDFEEFRRYVPPKLIGREGEMEALTVAWDQVVGSAAGRPLIITITGMGGAGKSSVVAQWAANLGHRAWPGCEAVLAWSFYSQGTREVASVSGDHFLKYALAFFRDPKMAGSSAKSAVKGARLAELIAQQRTLLILDGLEPLQYPPSHPLAGRLRDDGIASLLLGLTQLNPGLCIVTTRIPIADLEPLEGGVVRRDPLAGLSPEAGALLLQRSGVTGDIEQMRSLVQEVRGHALTLTLIGSFLKRAYGGHIAQRHQVKLGKADATMQGGQAFRAMEAYEQWLLQGGEEGRREVAVLRLMGLFDRPADAVSLKKLRADKIADFNESLVGLGDEDFALSLTALKEAHLLTLDHYESGELKSVDAHPLIREYFAGKISPRTRKCAEALLASDGSEHAQTARKVRPAPLLMISAVVLLCLAGLAAWPWLAGEGPPSSFQPKATATPIDTKNAPKIAAEAVAKSSPLDAVIRQMAPPVVELAKDHQSGEAVLPAEVATYTLRYRVSRGGDAVKRIRVLLDGRPATVDAPIPATDADISQAEVPLTVGRDCIIALMAENRFAVSEPVVFRIRRQEIAPTIAVNKPMLYVLAAGVSDYKQEADLQFAAKDATDFVAAVRRQEGGLYRKVEVRLLTDQNATAEKILDGLDWLRTESKARDVIMIFLSGHGVTDEQGRYNFCGYDYDPTRPLRTGVSRDALEGAVRDLPGKVLVFLDSNFASNSLGKFHNSKQSPHALNSLVNELASAENGAVIFSATTGRQVSLELPQVGNGAFAKALVEGLDGKADLLARGTITLSTLEAYLTERLKDLTDGLQTPTVAKPQTVPDFPIALKR